MGAPALDHTLHACCTGLLALSPASSRFIHVVVCAWASPLCRVQGYPAPWLWIHSLAGWPLGCLRLRPPRVVTGKDSRAESGGASRDPGAHVGSNSSLWGPCYALSCTLLCSRPALPLGLEALTWWLVSPSRLGGGRWGGGLARICQLPAGCGSSWALLQVPSCPMFPNRQVLQFQVLRTVESEDLKHRASKAPEDRVLSRIQIPTARSPTADTTNRASAARGPLQGPVAATALWVW